MIDQTFTETCRDDPILMCVDLLVTTETVYVAAICQMGIGAGELYEDR